ncbi:PEP-CTERM sorting domain-containing protein [Adhaeretor mobilis]|uniref:PEP-CTERM sorting domain-containing protein n=1 Tax=Adhaeretor mobilis TaxID=1930276 RepID=UPI001C54CDBB|nr:PEP-CTERM sorting domain-containing protein [Adhaeretor mobilis]
MSGGSIAYSLAVTSGGHFNMSGTAVVNAPRIIGGATATVTGGVVASSLNASSGSVVTLSGGAIGGRADCSAGSDVTFQGAEFQLNGTPIAGLVSPGDTTTLTVPEGSLFSGTLADGTPLTAQPTPPMQTTTARPTVSTCSLGSVIDATAVPEPTSLLLLSLASALTVRRPRRYLTR